MMQCFSQCDENAEKTSKVYANVESVGMGIALYCNLQLSLSFKLC